MSAAVKDLLAVILQAGQNVAKLSDRRSGMSGVFVPLVKRESNRPFD